MFSPGAHTTQHLRTQGDADMVESEDSFEKDPKCKFCYMLFGIGDVQVAPGYPLTVTKEVSSKLRDGTYLQLCPVGTR
jgi:hypothetical protein